MRHVMSLTLFLMTVSFSCQSNLYFLLFARMWSQKITQEILHCLNIKTQSVLGV